MFLKQLEKKYNVKGFTLIELLGTIILISVIALIAVPIFLNVTDNAKKKSYDLQVNSILHATKWWAYENEKEIPTDGSTYTLTLDKLAFGQFLDKYPINPITNKPMDGCVMVAKANQTLIRNYVPECNVGDNPIIMEKTVEPFTNKVKVTINAYALGGIEKVMYTIDNMTWHDAPLIFEMSDLKHNHTYRVNIKVVSKNGFITEDSFDVTTSKIDEPKITFEPKECSKSKFIVMKYPQGNFKYYYSINSSGQEPIWIETSSIYETRISQNGTIFAKVSDGTNEIYKTLNIDTIDQSCASIGVNDVNVIREKGRIQINVSPDNIPIDDIVSVRYSLDDENFIKAESLPTFYINNIDDNTTYNITLQITDKNGVLYRVKFEVVVNYNVGEIKINYSNENICTLFRDITIEFPTGDGYSYFYLIEGREYQTTQNRIVIENSTATSVVATVKKGSQILKHKTLTSYFTQCPRIEINEDCDGAVNTDTVYLHFAEDLESEYSYNDQPFTKATSNYIELTDIYDGSKIVINTYKDGKLVDVNSSIYYATECPISTTNFETDTGNVGVNTHVTSNKVTLNIDADGKYLGLWYSTDGGNTWIWVDGTRTKILGLKADTEYTIKIKIIDAIGSEHIGDIKVTTDQLKVPEIIVDNKDTCTPTKNVTIKFPYSNKDGYILQYAFMSESGQPQFTEVDQQEIHFTIDKPGVIIAQVSDGHNVGIENFNVTNIGNCEELENTIKIVGLDLKATMDSITGTIEVVDTVNGVKSVQYKLDNASNWINIENGKVNISSLSPGTTYNITFRAYNNKDKYVEKMETITTQNPESASIQISPSGWANEKTVKITINNLGTEYKHQYSLDGNNWVDITQSVTSIVFKENGSLLYRVLDKNDNLLNAISNNILEIERNKPVCNITVDNESIWSINKNIKVSATDDQSGVYGIQYEEDSNYTLTDSITVNAKKNGFYNFKVKDKAGNETTCSTNITKIDSTPPTKVEMSAKISSTTSVTITANAEDLESGIASYKYYHSTDNNIWQEVASTSSTHTYTDLALSKHYFKVMAYNATSSSKESAIEMVALNIDQPVITLDTTEWSITKNVTITYPEKLSGMVYQYKIGDDDWQTSDNKVKTINFTSEGSIIARVLYKEAYYSSSAYNITKIDSTPPTKVEMSAKVLNTTSVTITTNAEDLESGIVSYKYYHSTDNNIWQEVTSTSSTHTYTDLTLSKYYFKVIAYNASGLLKESAVETVTLKIDLPVITLDTTEWSASKNATITYPEMLSGMVYQYKIGNNSWQTTTDRVKTIKFTSAGSIIARVLYKDVYYSSSTYNISKIDATAPTILDLEVYQYEGDNFGGPNADLPIKYLIGNRAVDNESGIKKYSVSTTANKNDYYVHYDGVVEIFPTAFDSANQIEFCITAYNQAGLTKKSCVTVTNNAPIMNYNISYFNADCSYPEPADFTQTCTARFELLIPIEVYSSESQNYGSSGLNRWDIIYDRMNSYTATITAQDRWYNRYDTYVSISQMVQSSFDKCMQNNDCSDYCMENPQDCAYCSMYSPECGM